MRHIFVVLLLVGQVLNAIAQTTTHTFEVIYNEKNIGSLVAYKEVNGTRSMKDLKGNTDAKVLMLSVHVESEVAIHADKEVLEAGKGYRHTNRGANDVLTTVTRTADKKYKVVKNGTQTVINVPEIKFCVVDLIFRSPKASHRFFPTLLVIS